MTESFESLLKLILSQNPNLPVEEVVSLVERKKQESHGLLSDEGAIRLLAQQLSISQPQLEGVNDQRISSIQAGLNDASISGEIVAIANLQEFQKTDGFLGKVLRIRVHDSSGQITCVAWDSVAEFMSAKGFAVGSRLRLEHGYTRYGRAGEVEFHLGSRSNVQGLGPSFTRTARSGPVKISELSLNQSFDHGLSVRVKKLQPRRSEKGPVQALCEDETGLVIAKFWDETGEVALSIGEGGTIILENPLVAERNGLLNLNVGRNSSVSRGTESIGSPEPVPISSLKPEPVLRILRGKVVERSDMREIETREGRRAKVSNIKVEDETGRIRVSLWDRHAAQVETLRLGDVVKLTGVRVRTGFAGEVEASTVFLSEIEKS